METVRQIFVPALTEKGSKSLSEYIIAEGTQWSTALAICTQDRPNRRRKGSVFCAYLFSFADKLELR